MNVTRVRHLENALVHFRRDPTTQTFSAPSIDTHLRTYHAAHKSQLSIDDKDWLSDKFKDIYRWKSLIEHFSGVSNGPSDLLRAYFGSSNWRAYAASKVLPDHTRFSIPEPLFDALSQPVSYTHLTLPTKRIV